MDKRTAATLEAKIEAAINAVLEAEGMSKVTLTSRKWTSSSIIFTAECSETGRNRFADDYVRYCAMYGLPAEGLNATIILSGKAYVITGLDTKKPKNCVRMTEVRTGNTNWQCTTESAIRALGAK